MQSTHFEAVSSSTFNSTEDLDNLLISLAKIKLPPKNIIIDNQNRSKRDIQSIIKRDIEDNKKEQQRLGNDIILSNFPCKPDTEFVITKFCSLFKVLKSDLKFYRCFETKNFDKEGNVKCLHHVKISFKQKSMKLKVLETKHSIRYSMLSDKPLDNNAYEDTTIVCLNSLSRFNIDISKQLQHLVVNRIIKEYKFTNNFFEFKQNPFSSWISIEHHGVLQKWHDLLKSQQKLKMPTTHLQNQKTEF